jgi:hypothetical protein
MVTKGKRGGNIKNRLIGPGGKNKDIIKRESKNKKEKNQKRV